MNNINFLKPNKENLNLFLALGALFFCLGIIDFCLNNFYEKNITGFLPGFILISTIKTMIVIDFSSKFPYNPYKTP